MDILSHNKKQDVVPYEKLAYIYDEVMIHVNYRQWAQYILKIINKWHSQVHTILDVACGTGNLLISLNDNKYQLFGFDRCLAMVKRATNKTRHIMTNIHFFQGDMTSFRLKKKMDVVTCLYDSINYLMNFDAWRLMFDHVYDVLNDEGLFIFDVCTEMNSIKFFDNYSEQSQGADYEYIRESTYDRINKIHRNKFIIKLEGVHQNYVESHAQKIYAIKDIIQFIHETDFKMIGAFDGFSFRPASEESLRVHFVLRK